MVTFANRAKQVTATTGTGSITLGSAVGGYQTFASAGATGTVRYTIEDGDAWEIGSGAISGSTLSRTLDESSTGALLNLSGSAIVFVTAAAEDIQQPPAEGAFANGDKTKLDGIEASADVTDATNVTAAGALMDSEVTNLAQVKAFDSTDYATSAQGTTADSAVQPADLATVATTGAYSDLSGLPTLGTAASTASTDYATSAQGTTADSAVQPADLATVATTGAYSDLSGLPTLGTAAATASTDYATAAQGNTADSALQDITGQSIENLSDVASMTPSTNQVLSWNGTAWASADAAGGGGGITYTRYTANVTIAADAGAIADTSGGSFTVTLPASPSTGDIVVIADGADWSTNNLTVGRNGSTIEGAAEDLTLDIGNVSATFIYDGTTWQVYIQAGASEPIAFTASSTDTLTNKTISGSSNTITVDGTNSTGYLKLPPVGTKTSSYTLQTADVGKYVQVGAGGSITVPDATFAEGDAVSLFNNTTGDITVTCSVTTAYIAGTDADVASVTLATRGVANVLFISGTICVITGNVS